MHPVYHSLWRWGVLLALPERHSEICSLLSRKGFLREQQGRPLPFIISLRLHFHLFFCLNLTFHPSENSAKIHISGFCAKSKSWRQDKNEKTSTTVNALWFRFHEMSNLTRSFRCRIYGVRINAKLWIMLNLKLGGIVRFFVQHFVRGLCSEKVWAFSKIWAFSNGSDVEYFVLGCLRVSSWDARLVEN